MSTTTHNSFEPVFPDLEATWAPVYLEPVVESGERLTIGVVATDGREIASSLAINERALQCLYGESASGMLAMMEMALRKAEHYAKSGFDTSFSSGIHGVLMGPARDGIGDSLEDIVSQGISLTSSLSMLHEDEARSLHDRSTYWKRLKKEMERVDANLVPHFGQTVPVSIRGTTLSLSCDYFSSRLAVNVCSLSANYRLGNLFDAATSKVFRLEQLKDHDALIGHDHKATMMLVTPPELAISQLKPGARKNFEERILLLQDMAAKRDFDLVAVHTPLEGAKAIRKMELSAA